jgi:hypothetical protein
MKSPAKLTVLVVLLCLLTGILTASAQETPFVPPLGYPPAFAPGINPLTGLPLDETRSFSFPPLIVKVSNAPDVVRPQAGIGMADVVFEHYAEGGLTRFSAIYYSELPARIGSVRSARLIDNELTPMFGALLAYSGASPGTEAVLSAADYAPRLFSGYYLGAPFFVRDFTIAAPNNLFIDPAQIWAAAQADGYTSAPDLRGWVFAFDPPPGESGPAAVLDMQYTDNRVSWAYDEALALYRRSDDGLPHSDALTGMQVAASTVVVLYADHLPTTIEEGVWNGQPYYGIDIVLSGEGQAIALRNGRQYPLTWRRAEREGLLTLWTADGQPFALKPGKTWFQVFPPPAVWQGGEFVSIQ